MTKQSIIPRRKFTIRRNYTLATISKGRGNIDNKRGMINVGLYKSRIARSNI
jgi:hypothetical protein